MSVENVRGALLLRKQIYLSPSLQLLQQIFHGISAFLHRTCSLFDTAITTAVFEILWNF